MSDISAEGMEVAPGVIETIIAMAAREVPGVICVGSQSTASGILSFLSQKQTAPGVDVAKAEDGGLDIIVNLTVSSEPPLKEIAENVRQAVASAVVSQVGMPISRVDIAIQAIQFND